MHRATALLLSAAAAAAAAADPTETILRRARHCASLKAIAAELVPQPQQAPHARTRPSPHPNLAAKHQ